MTAPPDKRPPLTPRHWPSWLGVAALWLLGKTPLSIASLLSSPLGAVLYRAMGRRREIARRNLERCFPEWSGPQREACLAASFRSLARMVFEITWAWSGRWQRMESRCELIGLEHLRRAEAQGRGVLVITGHFTTLEIGARIMGSAVDAAAVYRPLKNPVLEWYQTRSRLAYAGRMISKRDVRAAVRYLRRGGTLWYAPDQDFGGSQSDFAPFFGIATATLLASVRLPAMTGCAVVPMFPKFRGDGARYTVEFQPALEDFPSDDVTRDLARINAIMEAQIRSAPEQYWWIHRRFKTRPAGELPFYD